MTNLSTLIADLERATEGSRELDARIARHIGIRVVEVSGEYLDWPARQTEYADEGPRGDIPRYTTSIDAAMTLVPERWDWDVGTDHSVFVASTSQQGDKEANTGLAPTPALALVIAALKATGGGE